VLHTRTLGETSKLVTLYSEGCGKLKVTAKGARQPKSKFGGRLELLSEIQAVCYVRDDRELQILSDCEILQAHWRLAVDLERFCFGSAAIELIDRLTIEGEPNVRLYICLTGFLGALGEVAADQLEPLFWYYQLRVIAALGYRPELVWCVICRKKLEGPWLWFNAAQGGGLCPDCGRSNGLRIAGQNLRLLAYLQGLKTYRKEAIPPNPEQNAECRMVMCSFVEYHGGFGRRLRALDFLKPLPGLSPSRLGSAPIGIDKPAVQG